MHHMPPTPPPAHRHSSFSPAHSCALASTEKMKSRISTIYKSSRHQHVCLIAIMRCRPHKKSQRQAAVASSGGATTRRTSIDKHQLDAENKSLAFHATKITKERCFTGQVMVLIASLILGSNTASNCWNCASMR